MFFEKCFIKVFWCEESRVLGMSGDFCKVSIFRLEMVEWEVVKEGFVVVDLGDISWFGLVG